MTNEELIAIISSHRRNALGYEDGDLSNERATALDHYHGRPYGDEETGKSQVVSKDLSETAGWIMPAVMKVFTQSGALGEFPPEGPDDIELAKQESEYTNKVIMEDNDGYLVLFDFCWDALILKNGYVKHWWEETEKKTTSSYTGLDEEALAMLMMELGEHKDVKVLGQEERTETIMEPLPDGTIVQIEIPVFDIDLEMTEMKGQLVLEAVPAEEVKVSKACRGSLQGSPFTEHTPLKTRTELIEMGMSREFVDDLPAYTSRTNDTETNARDTVTDETDETTITYTDRAMDEIAYCEAYIKVDFDGDGIAELRKVITAGNKIPPGKEWNERIDAVPMTGGIAKRVPHRHVGESLDDDMADLQQIKTVLTRQMLDNVYRTNNGEHVVNERAAEYMEDWMKSLPGGVKRLEGMDAVAGHFQALDVPPILNQILPAIDYVEGMKEARSGVSKTTTQIDPDVLRETTKGAYLASLDRASQKVEMIIRTLAETGVKEIMLQSHAILNKHQDKPRVMELRGKYETVNPQEWKERNNLKVKVGLGTGTEEEKRQKLMIMSELQDKLREDLLVGPEQGFHLFNELAETLGYENAEKFAINPESEAFQENKQFVMGLAQQNQEQGNPLAEAEMVKAKGNMEIEQIRQESKQQLELAKLESQQEIDSLKALLKESQEDADRRSKEAIAAMQEEVKLAIANMPKDLGAPGISAGVQDE